MWNLIYDVCHLLGWILFKTLFRLKVVGVENIPEESGVLIVSNHVSYLDPIILGVALRRRAAFMAMAELFDVPLLSNLIRGFNAFPIKRGKVDRWALNEAVQILHDGGVLVTFPEGTRSHDGALQQGKPGIGMIAIKVAKEGVKVIPTKILGTERALPRGSHFIRFSKIEVRFGKPISFFDLLPFDSNSKPYREAVDRIMENIRKL
jgi:1-acyl-sn-glycerol-3-phosphate acyltransferase